MPANAHAGRTADAVAASALFGCASSFFAHCNGSPVSPRRTFARASIQETTSEGKAERRRRTVDRGIRGPFVAAHWRNQASRRAPQTFASAAAISGSLFSSRHISS
ncbi:MAG: hypothetical protein KAI41_02345, partial [Hyphomicrobiaceae bacterium]|nr:hypothetical protein [Hyphomicrobiaceae bacterium]